MASRVAEYSAGPAILAIDTVLLGVVAFFAMRSERFWPLWFTAFLLVGVLGEISSVLFSQYAAGYFRMISAFWALPCLLAMPAGIFLDRRADARMATSAIW